MIATQYRGTGRVKLVLHVLVCLSGAVLPRETRWCHISIHGYDCWRFGGQDCIGGARKVIQFLCIDTLR